MAIELLMDYIPLKFDGERLETYLVAWVSYLAQTFLGAENTRPTHWRRGGCLLRARGIAEIGSSLRNSIIIHFCFLSMNSFFEKGSGLICHIKFVMR